MSKVKIAKEGGPYDIPMSTKVNKRAYRAVYLTRLIFKMDTTQIVSNAILEYAEKHGVWEEARKLAENE